MKATKITALLWLLIFTGLAYSTGAHHADSAESHALPQALQIGFDAFGRDCLKLTLVAAYHSFQVLIPMAFMLIGIALVLSLIRFLSGQWFMFFFRSVLDTLSSLPGLLVALAIGSFFRSSNAAFIIACGISLVPYLFRFFEGQISELQSRSYFQSTLAMGANSSHMYFHYVVPELLSSVVAVFPFLMTRLILIETSFSFLGIQSFTKGETWGRLLYQGKDYLLEAPWIIACVGAPLFLTLLAFHLLSDDERN